MERNRWQEPVEFFDIRKEYWQEPVLFIDIRK